jgi:hypothetical protein
VECRENSAEKSQFADLQDFKCTEVYQRDAGLALVDTNYGLVKRWGKKGKGTTG